MVRPLAEALRKSPLFFEPVPPPARTSAARAEERIVEVTRLVKEVSRLDAVDVPELVDENHEGRPFYRTADPRSYGRAVAERTGCEVVVNKVVAHLESGAALKRWAEETVREGLRHLVLVGGTSRYIPYPGPPVTEADRIVRPIVEGAGGLLGNIAIPFRAGEAHRMLAKTRAGARFFTTQLVFDSDPVVTMLREYDALCRRASIPPAAVLLSFGPLADEQDAEFVRWLGAEIPEVAERAILEGTDPNAVERSFDRAFQVWGATVEAARRDELAVPLGVNVEQISTRHFEPARTLLLAFAERLPEPEPSVI